jgi:Calcium binding
MIEEATVDAYGESEQIGGFYTMLDEHLAVPFETTLLGVLVTVRGFDITERDEIVAICSRGRLRQAIPILDLVIPSPAPAGAEWIEAYRRWASRG